MSDRHTRIFRTMPDYSVEENPEFSAVTVKEFDADDQPRERAKRYGISSLCNADLFALILRTGLPGYPVTALCRDLMKMNQNLFLNLERCSREQIMEIKGIGETKALQIEAVMEIVRRYSRERVGDRINITSPEVIYDVMKPEIANLPHEEIWALFVNRQNQIIGKMRISQGSSVASVFDLKKVIKNALMARAEGIVLCHNHPSGNLRPSPDDDRITRKLREACDTLELRLLDHVIVTTDGFYSYSSSSAIFHSK